MNKGIINIKSFLVTLLISIIITVVAMVLLKDYMFVHRAQTIITDWSQCNSNGYEFDGQRVTSVAADPCVYFYSGKNVEHVEIDISMISNTENLLNQQYNGEEVIYAELFWADESGEIKSENSIPFKIGLGRNSFLFDVDCPAGTLFRLDIGDGADVVFDVNSIVFDTYESYDNEEKIESIIMMFILVFVALYSGYFVVRKGDK